MKTLYPSLIAFMLLFTTNVSAQVPKLNSFPTAPAVIFLDFDGHTVNGTSWNANGPIFCGPSNLNSTQITEVFNRIAEDYRPFNINVTTDSTKYFSVAANRRMRVIMTITWEWYGRAGGVAFTGSFSWGDNTPCFVFTSLHNYNIKNIAEAGAHEAGHTLGLRHQSKYDPTCVKVEDYNSGAGSGQVSWAPIMGVSYYRNQTTWHNGPNPFGCTNAQDDLAIITSTTNGFGYRPDDHTATFKTATNAVINNKQFQTSGNISTNFDEDMFKVSMPVNGRFNLQVEPYSVATSESGSNLDVEIKLYNGSQQLLKTYNPIETLGAAIDTTLNKGDYYFTVTGAGNNYTTEYASLGAYNVKGFYSDLTPLPLRKLELKGIAEGSKHILNWIIDADEAVVKQVLEVAANGRAFEPVAHLGNDERNYQYPTFSTGTLQYRVSVTFDNGKQHYSNIIAMRNGEAAGKPRLLTNVIHNQLLQVNSPGAYSYTITDMHGRQISKGQNAAGSASVNTGYLAPGIYAISFQSGSEQQVQKFTKQ